MTRQRAARRIDQHQLASPSAHAGFGEAGVVVGNDHVDADLAAQTLLGRCHHGHRAVQLRARGQQCRPVLERPAVVLRVRDLHAIGMERFERGNHFLEVFDVLPVNDEVYCECDATLADLISRIQPASSILCACARAPAIQFAGPSLES